MIICIVGAGAAGMMAAISAREQNPHAEVIVIEKNAILGRKVIISGGGRCNVTTGITNVREVLQRYPRGGAFLTSALYAFPPQQVMDWFEQHGVALKVEDDQRVFPQSDDGKEVVGVFERLFREQHIEALTREAVIDVRRTGKQFEVILKSQRVVIADALILTTGGQAYRHTGSTGDGYHFAETLGHTVTPLASSLNSFVLAEAWSKMHSGLSFERVGLRVLGHHEAHAVGPIVFTHQGISGPAVFVVAAWCAFTPYSSEAPLVLNIDFCPDTSADQLLSDINTYVEQHPKQSVKTMMRRWLPVSLVDTMLYELGINPALTNAEATKILRRGLVNWLKSCPVSAVGRGSGAEFVTAGGVDTSEVDPRTMQSRICPGLFFAGELLNVDGFTGGFNLQASWATGHVAGTYAARL